MKLEEMSAVEILAGKEIKQLYGYPLFVAMAENKNDLYKRSYSGKSLRIACRRLIELLSEVSQAHFYNFFGIVGKELPYSVPELTEIYSTLLEARIFTEVMVEKAWWQPEIHFLGPRQYSQKQGLIDTWREVENYLSTRRSV